MYLKFVKPMEEQNGVSNSKGNPEEQVVPYDTRLFEAKTADYKKVRVLSDDELDSLTDELLEFYCLYDLPEQVDPEAGCEVLITYVTDNGGDVETLVVGPECTLFVMNNEGKTIDSVSTA